LNELLVDINIKPFSIASLCETQWSCRYKNCVLNSIGAVIQILEKKIDEQVSRNVPQAIGKMFKFYILHLY